MKKLLNFFKHNKQEKDVKDERLQALSDAFGTMLEYARKSRQEPYVIDNDIWYS